MWECQSLYRINKEIRILLKSTTSGGFLVGVTGFEPAESLGPKERYGRFFGKKRSIYAQIVC